jgi:hypothetical protein
MPPKIMLSLKSNVWEYEHLTTSERGQADPEMLLIIIGATGFMTNFFKWPTKKLAPDIDWHKRRFHAYTATDISILLIHK